MVQLDTSLFNIRQFGYFARELLVTNVHTLSFEPYEKNSDPFPIILNLLKIVSFNLRVVVYL